MNVRLLDLGSVSILRSQSIYHGLTAALRPDDDPIITFMLPQGSYVSIGYSQEAEKEVDLEFCRRNQLPVIRRHVGGGAVLLDSNQLFFHVILPVARTAEFGLPRTLINRFAYLAQPPIKAYHKLGIPARFRPINDIQVDGKKIGGTGTGEINEGLVFAGSMMMDFNHALMAKVLKVPDEKMRDKIHQTLQSYITSIKGELGRVLPVHEIAAALADAFETCYGIKLIPSVITDREWEQIHQWDERLQDETWFHRVKLAEKPYRAIKITANVRILTATHKAPGGLMRLTVRVIDGKIDDLLLSGDFAYSPQDALWQIAEKFKGSAIDLTELKANLLAVIAEQEIDFAGVEQSDFEQLVGQIT
jgi:lipoate-protein ligase A